MKLVLFLTRTLLVLKQYQKNVPTVFCGRLQITEQSKTYKLKCLVIKNYLKYGIFFSFKGLKVA